MQKVLLATREMFYQLQMWLTHAVIFVCLMYEWVSANLAAWTSDHTHVDLVLPTSHIDVGLPVDHADVFIGANICVLFSITGVLFV